LYYEYMLNQYFVYILTNSNNKVLYVGVTNNLARRVYEHQNGLIKGFTSKYNVKKLVYFEIHSDINEAIRREKQLKNWHHDWKINFIRLNNPDFNDLASNIL